MAETMPPASDTKRRARPFAGKNAAEVCREQGWTVGTRLAGDEGYGVTVIEITAIGERNILAKALTRVGVDQVWHRETNWTLECRDWRPIA